jgi:hypothetical protein
VVSETYGAFSDTNTNLESPSPRALQEHVLSTRIVHYTATELLFECKTSYRCECMPERKAYPTTPSLIPKAVISKKPNAIYDAWHHIVEKYTARSLTVAADKFPAISGIASKIHKATSSGYLAGLWKGNLASDLLWSAPPLESAKTYRFALEEWRAPTFSWASLDTPVTYTNLDDEELESFAPAIALVASAVTPKGLNPLGTISDASITLRGSIITATLCSEQNHERWKYLLLIKGTSSISIAPDCVLVESDFTTEEGTVQNTVRRGPPGAIPRNFKAPVLCLSVARYDSLVAGLVLGVSARSPQAWERLGTFAAGTEAVQSVKEMELMLV